MIRWSKCCLLHISKHMGCYFSLLFFLIIHSYMINCYRQHQKERLKWMFEMTQAAISKGQFINHQIVVAVQIYRVHKKNMFATLSICHQICFDRICFKQLVILPWSTHTLYSAQPVQSPGNLCCLILNWSLLSVSFEEQQIGCNYTILPVLHLAELVIFKIACRMTSTCQHIGRYCTFIAGCEQF